MELLTDVPMIGRVLRASTTGFECGTRSSDLSEPRFGAFVQARRRNDSTIIIGLIYAIRVDDDPLVRQLIMANNLNAATIRDQRENRMVPVEISVITVGGMEDNMPIYTLPPRPPLSLDPVYLCDDEMVYTFTERFDFFRLVLQAAQVPSEELLAAALRFAAAVRPRNEQADYLIRAGRRLAQLLSADLPRLHHLLRLIRPT
ncbi:MAG: hypothetical protein RML95_10035 [Anaerolineae bacterium]|nr:hypothetical protein [Anaerolineae bacterium]MDW8299664.1 hypothetical protein [Anaerolineae bacterium]